MENQYVFPIICCLSPPFFDVRQDALGTTALRSVGLSVKDKGGKKLGPTSQYVNNPRSGTEMMEGIVNTLKQAYYPAQINVATWDAALKLDTMKCCGLKEYGTAKSANGLEYRFAVFQGAGQMHWTGEKHGLLVVDSRSAVLRRITTSLLDLPRLLLQ